MPGSPFLHKTMTTRFASPLGLPPTWEGPHRRVLQKLLENWKAVRVAITKVLGDLQNVSQRLMTEPHGESIVETGGWDGMPRTPGYHDANSGSTDRIDA